MKNLLLLPAILFLFSCGDLVENALTEEAEKDRELDSLALLNEEENPLERSSFVADRYEIIERSKSGNDSIFKVRTFYHSGEKFGEEVFRNRSMDGISVYYYKNGKIFCRVKFKDGRSIEIMEAKDDKGKDLDYGNYKNGTGKLITYNPESGNIDNEVNYTNYKRQGGFSYYYGTGELKAKGTYTNDTLSGPVNVFFKNGKMRETDNFLQGVKDGKQIQFYTNGKIKRIEIWKDKFPLSFSEYNRKGQLTTSTTSTPTSTTENRFDYLPDGSTLSKSIYVNGMKDGTFSYYHENKKLKREELWKKDTLISEKEWFDNGKLRSESIYKNNMKSGIYKEYYANGNVRQVAEYANGMQNGKTTSYYGNGKLYFTGTYVDDKPFGKFDYYKEDGTFKGSNVFK